MVVSPVKRRGADGQYAKSCDRGANEPVTAVSVVVVVRRAGVRVVRVRTVRVKHRRLLFIWVTFIIILEILVVNTLLC